MDNFKFFTQTPIVVLMPILIAMLSLKLGIALEYFTMYQVSNDEPLFYYSMVFGAVVYFAVILACMRVHKKVN